MKFINKLLFVFIAVCATKTDCRHEQRVFDYKESRIKSELFDVMPLIEKGIKDKRIAKVYFSRKKKVFELTKFPKMIFKASKKRPLKSFAHMQDENEALKSIIKRYHLDLMCIPHKEYLSVIDDNQHRWYVTIEEKGDLAASGVEGQQGMWDSLSEKAKFDKNTAAHLETLIAQLTTFTCLSCITDITFINFSFLKNGKIMVVDTDADKDCHIGLNKIDFAQKSSIFEGLATLLFCIPEDYFSLVVKQAAFIFKVRAEAIMHGLFEYLKDDLKKKFVHLHVKDNQSMVELKKAINKAKSFYELRLSGMSILKEIDATKKSKSIEELSEHAQKTLKTIVHVAQSKPFNGVVKNILHL